MEQHHNAKFAFFYMLSLVALVFTAISTGMIIFQIINKTMSDLVNSGMYSSGALKFAISAIIIAAPIYYITMWRINKSLRLGQMNPQSGIRRWLTYLILFVVSVVVIGWLIATVNSFLDGQMTWKFILKFLTVLAISAIIFTYYLYDIKRGQTNGQDKVICVYLYATILVVLSSFVAALFFVESPKAAGQRRHDEAIVDSFNNISAAVNQYYVLNQKLPANLQELVDQAAGGKYYYLTPDSLMDQVTKEPYVYEIVNGSDYRLCATFLSSTKDTTNNDLDSRYRFDGRWTHEAGYQCLDQTAVDFNKGDGVVPTEVMP